MTSSTSAIHIRRATVADAAIIAHHRTGMFRDMGELDDSEVAGLEAGTRDRLAVMIANDEYFGWLLEFDDVVVAGAGVVMHPRLPRRENPLGRPEAYLLNVYTEPAFRRRGLARRLIAAILEWCAENDIPRAGLHASVAGRPLYEQLGFTETNEMRAEVSDVLRRYTSSEHGDDSGR